MTTTLIFPTSSASREPRRHHTISAVSASRSPSVSTSRWTKALLKGLDQRGGRAGDVGELAVRNPLDLGVLLMPAWLCGWPSW